MNSYLKDFTLKGGIKSIASALFLAILILKKAKKGEREKGENWRKNSSYINLAI